MVALSSELLSPPLLALIAVFFAAFACGTVVGFGTTVLTVAFASQLMPFDVILPVIAPLNVALSLYIAVRHRAQTEWRLLLRRLLPLAAFGVPVGLLLFRYRDQGGLRLLFGVFVIAVAAVELRPLLAGFRGAAARAAGPLPAWAAAGGLFAGGLLHGLFNTGGPMLVYVVARELPDKSRFRSTMGTLFVPLTAALIVDYAMQGLMTRHTVSVTLLSALPVVLGVWLGERLHDRVDQRTFRLVLWTVLLLGGVVLSVRAW